MAGAAKVYENAQLKSAIGDVDKFLDNIGIAPGNDVWAIRTGCCQCPEEGDHCAIGCKRKDKKYLEKVTIKETNVIIKEESQFSVTFKDRDGEEYSVYDIDVSVFTDREEALNRLWVG